MQNILTVSSLSIIFMSVSIALSVLVPLGLIIYMGIKKRINWKALIFGAVLFVVFVYLLEATMHRFVLGTDPTKSAVYQNPLIYMFYGAFAAGIFEETARWLGFKFLIRVRENESIDTGISYGLGHGGIEAILIGGFSMISNLIVSVMLNSGALKSVTAAMNSQQLDAFNTGMAALTQTESYVFLLSGIERVTALVLQISLSLFVLKAVRERKWKYFLLAILMHAAVDFVAIMFQRGYIQNMLLLEGLVLVMTVVIAITAFKSYIKTDLINSGISKVE
ncbi:MAG TPA: YhfC family glutamic-type intramembrane protease [Clostridia bacterium]|nr:YhfC family glutamic-type intramembrane protease [Clostridia bacterium]